MDAELHGSDVATLVGNRLHDPVLKAHDTHVETGDLAVFPVDRGDILSDPADVITVLIRLVNPQEYPVVRENPADTAKIAVFKMQGIVQGTAQDQQQNRGDNLSLGIHGTEPPG
jgi:hypothetical protein